MTWRQLLVVPNLLMCRHAPGWVSWRCVQTVRGFCGLESPFCGNSLSVDVKSICVVFYCPRTFHSVAEPVFWFMPAYHLGNFIFSFYSSLREVLWIENSSTPTFPLPPNLNDHQLNFKRSLTYRWKWGFTRHTKGWCRTLLVQTSSTSFPG